MTQEDGLKILQYNITKLQTYITFHVILLNKVGVSTTVSSNSGLGQSVVISSFVMEFRRSNVNAITLL